MNMSAALDIGGDEIIEVTGDLRLHTEPMLESRYGLVQQHAEAANNGMAARLGLDKQAGLQRHIDDIGHDRVRLQPVERQIERWLPFMPSDVVLISRSALGSKPPTSAIARARARPG